MDMDAAAECFWTRFKSGEEENPLPNQTGRVERSRATVEPPKFEDRDCRLFSI